MARSAALVTLRSLIPVITSPAPQLLRTCRVRHLMQKEHLTVLTATCSCSVETLPGLHFLHQQVYCQCMLELTKSRAVTCQLSCGEQAVWITCLLEHCHGATVVCQHKCQSATSIWYMPEACLLTRPCANKQTMHDAGGQQQETPRCADHQLKVAQLR